MGPPSKQLADEKSIKAAQANLMLHVLFCLARYRPSVVIIDSATNLDAASWGLILGATKGFDGSKCIAPLEDLICTVADWANLTLSFWHAAAPFPLMLVVAHRPFSRHYSRLFTYPADYDRLRTADEVIKIKLDTMAPEEAADLMAAEFGAGVTSISLNLFKVSRCVVGWHQGT